MCVCGLVCVHREVVRGWPSPLLPLVAGAALEDGASAVIVTHQTRPFRPSWDMHCFVLCKFKISCHVTLGARPVRLGEVFFLLGLPILYIMQSAQCLYMNMRGHPPVLGLLWLHQDAPSRPGPGNEWVWGQQGWLEGCRPQRALRGGPSSTPRCQLTDLSIFLEKQGIFHF